MLSPMKSPKRRSASFLSARSTSKRKSVSLNCVTPTKVVHSDLRNFLSSVTQTKLVHTDLRTSAQTCASPSYRRLRFTDTTTPPRSVGHSPLHPYVSSKPPHPSTPTQATSLVRPLCFPAVESILNQQVVSESLAHIDPWLSQLREVLKRKHTKRIQPLVREQNWMSILRDQEEGCDPLLLPFTLSTRSKHLAIRTRLRHFLERKALRVTDATMKDLLAFIREQELARNWLPATRETMLGTLLGSLRGHPLATLPEWKLVLRSAKQQTLLQPIKWPEIFLISEMKFLMDSTTDDETLLLFVLAWSAALRIGDALKIRTMAIIHHSMIAQDAWALLLQGGKTTKIDQRTSYVRLGRFNTLFISRLESRKQQGKEYLFEDTQPFRKHLLYQMRRANAFAEFRSFRATRIMVLSYLKCPLNTLQIITTHSELKMLKRYLRFGLADVKTAEEVYQVIPLIV